ncbi:MAG: hypothetical protein ACR2MP_06835, partial [Streptosporangiaceae bacterium]
PAEAPPPPGVTPEPYPAPGFSSGPADEGSPAPDSPAADSGSQPADGDPRPADGDSHPADQGSAAADEEHPPF